MNISQSLTYLDFRQLKYFVEVAQAGSISGGAQALNMSQPPLSKTIQDLEIFLGTTLFERNARGVVLTEAGRFLFREAKIILTRSSEAAHLVRRVGRGEVGKLRIGVLGWLLWGDIPKLIGEFSLINPEVNVSIQDYGPAQQIEMLQEGQLDVGINRVFGMQNNWEKFQSQILRVDDLYAVLPSNHALAKQSSVTLLELQELDLITMAENVSDLSQSVMSAHLDCGISPRIGQRTLEVHAALAFVANGLGYSIFPNTLGRIPWPGLTFLPISNKLPQLELRTFWTPSTMSPVAKKFVEFLQQHFQGRDARIV